jgi:monoamine oxidase
MNELAKRDLMDSTDFGETIRLTSAFVAGTEYIGSNATDEMDAKIRGGNSKLVYALIDGVGQASLFMGAKVTAVHQNAEKVNVFVEERCRPFTAEYCICSVPAHCLLKIRWKPELPSDQSAAAQQLQYSRIMKTAVLFNKRFWKRGPKGGFSVFTTRVSDFCFDSTHRQRGKHGILCSYAIGDKADNLASEPNKHKVMKWIKEDMQEVAASKMKDVEALDVSPQAWQKETWIGGAYAFYRPGQWFTVRPILQRPHGRVLFAGEHLADWQGFMEGAVNTGEAAADIL